MRERKRSETVSGMRPLPVEGRLPYLTGDWFTPTRFAGLLGLLLALSFPLVVVGLNAFTYLDSGLFAYPVAFYHRECFWRGELPLWNPLNNCGLPFLAQWNTLTLYPLSLIYLLLPVPWSFGIFCLLHLFLAGFGAYFLARHWTGSQLGAAFAGAAFAFNGLTWYGLMWPHIIAAAAWTPWLILASEAAWRRGRQFVIIAGLAGAAQMLSGGAEVILQTWLLLGALWIVELLRREIPWTKLAFRLFATGAITAALAAVQLLPFLDLLQFSQRSASFSDPAVAAMPATGWANYLVPLFHFCRNVQGIFVPAKLSWTGSWYLGVGTIVLAVLAFCRLRERRLTLLLLAALFSMVMALGNSGGLYPLLKTVLPQLGFIRFPVKFIFLATVALSLSAAFGIAWLQRLPPEKWPLEWKWLKAAVLSLLGVMCFIVFLAWLRPSPKDDVSATVLNALTRVVFLICIPACLVYLRNAKPRLQVLLQVALVGLAWLDVYTHGSDLSPTVPAELVRPDATRALFDWKDELQPGASRAMLTGASMHTLLTAGSNSPEIDTQGRRLALYMNYNLLDGVPKVDGLYALELGNYDAVRNLLYLTNRASGFKDFMGVSHLSNPTNITQWLRRDSFLPLVTGGQRPVFADPTATLRALFADDFNPLQTVYLPAELESVARVGPSKVTLQGHKFSAHRVEIEAEAESPALVVIAQSYYYRWRAYVDGAAVPLWRANFAFQCLKVPAGKHKVLLAYEDQPFVRGATISLITLLLCLAAFIWCARRSAGAASVAESKPAKIQGSSGNG